MDFKETRSWDAADFSQQYKGGVDIVKFKLGLDKNNKIIKTERKNKENCL